MFDVLVWYTNLWWSELSERMDANGEPPATPARLVGYDSYCGYFNGGSAPAAAWTQPPWPAGQLGSTCDVLRAAAPLNSCPAAQRTECRTDESSHWCRRGPGRENNHSLTRQAESLLWNTRGTTDRRCHHCDTGPNTDQWRPNGRRWIEQADR